MRLLVMLSVTSFVAGAVTGTTALIGLLEWGSRNDKPVRN